MAFEGPDPDRVTVDEASRVTDVQAERTRFTFAFDRSMAELLGPERMAALVGTHIDFRWNNHLADALVKEVSQDPVTGVYSVTMEIEADLGLGQSLSFSGQPSMTVYEA